MNKHAPSMAADDAAAAAIDSVLQAEAAAREAIEQAQEQAEHIAERARADARALTARAERRIRAVVTAFGQDIDARVAEIDAEAARMALLSAPSDTDIAALRRGVVGLARALTEGNP